MHPGAPRPTPTHTARSPLNQLTSREPEQFTDLARGGRPLGAAGVAHGDMVYLLYDFVRQVEPAYRKTPLEARPFGERAAGTACCSRCGMLQYTPHTGPSGMVPEDLFAAV